MNTKQKLTKRMEVAAKRAAADLIIRNGNIVNVFTGSITSGDIAVVDGMIAGIGEYTDAVTVIDAAGQWIIPGLIDGHVHIESSMLTPREFSKVVLQHGVTAVVTDPHEMANVMGSVGIQYMLDQSEGLPLDIYVNLPSCVPSTPFETSGATLEAEELREFYKHPKVLGLAEVMDFPALASGNPGMTSKLADANDFAAHIDGHAAGINGDLLNLYMAAGIRTDHEAINAEEATHRLELGMYLMIREGTVAKDLEALLPAVTPHNSRRCLFVTDDKLIDDLLEEGSVDYSIRLAVSKGLDPVTAIQMATINAAECFGLRQQGAIAPGYKADLVIVDNLEALAIRQVFKEGVSVYKDGELVEEAFASNRTMSPESLHSSNMKQGMKPLLPHALQLPLESDICHVIGIIPNSLVTRHLTEQVDRDSEKRFVSSVERDQLKIAVVERHHHTGNIGRAIVKGFGFRKGAIVSSVAHDSHNVICAGVSDDDMRLAIDHVVAMNGGLAVVADGEILASLSLPVGGLLSEESYAEVNRQMQGLYEALRSIGDPDAFNPFLTLSFLALPVIPELKLTDKGLFEFASNSHIPLEAR
ncbi:adenine deaminase [Paenibacillus glycanilyticus]|uniref:Adenine deaminase n=1 Tax=Paenibacillus glycanilyticus TaxID=126569 RepID=A0ABQ6G7C9_9BACL|nr:adenine deaminase [Paenibacillus glycanilyticus]GLX66477.1 adenine deaminase [Paenibacillus glycanilyticus]